MSNSTIKKKLNCKKENCKNDALIAGYCHWHYWEHRKKVNTEKRQKQGKASIIPKRSADKVQKETFGTYFANQAHKMPVFCEETGKRLPTYPAYLKLSCMAHILPKRKDFGFKSVSIHPMNMVFVLPEIHQSMDQLGERFITKMKIYPIIKERVKVLLPLLTENELDRVPKYLL